MRVGGRRRAPERAGNLVQDLLGRRGMKAAVREHRLVTSWDEIVGERVAARAWPDGLKAGVLYVRVANSSWLHELSFLREVIMESANRLLGAPPVVREVRLHLGARRDADSDDIVAELAAKKAPRRAAKARPPVDARTVAAIDRETAQIGDADLREIIRNVRRKLGL